MSVHPDPLVQGIAEARGPQMISPDGETLSLMTRLLAKMHRSSPRLLDLLELLYQQAERLKLREEDMKGIFVPEDPWRHVVARFVARRYDDFLKALETWWKATGLKSSSTELQHPNALAVALDVIVDLEVTRRDTQTSLSEALLEALDRQARYHRAHRAVEITRQPRLILPFYSPQKESKFEYRQRCEPLIIQYMQEVEDVHRMFGAVERKEYSAEEKHLEVLALRLTSQRQATLTSLAHSVKLAPSTTSEALITMANRIGISLPSATSSKKIRSKGRKTR